MKYPKLAVMPCQPNHGETLVIVDLDLQLVVAESPEVLDYSGGAPVAASYPASENVYGELFRMFAAAPAMLAALRNAREVIEHAPMPYTSPATLAEIDRAIAAAEDSQS
jgi:hypothetical protein